MGKFFSCIYDCVAEAFPAWGTLALVGAVVGILALASLFGLSMTTPAGAVIGLTAAAVAKVVGGALAASLLGSLIACILRCIFG